MSTSKHIYNYGDRERVIIVNHGASESMVIYDSEDELTDWSPKSQKQTNLERWLKKAKSNDDL